MFRVVVAEFCQRKEASPVGLLVVAVHSQVLLQHRVEPLRLAICLRVERGRPIGSNATELQETAPEVGREDRITIAHQGFRQAVNPNDVVKEQGRHVRCRHGFGCRDEHRSLRQAVDHHQNGIVVVAGRQVRDPIEGHTAPGVGRNREGG